MITARALEYSVRVVGMQEKYPEEVWAIMPMPDMPVQWWISAVDDWERLAAQWEDGDYSNADPANCGSLMPFGILYNILKVIWLTEPLV
eukprot:SAG31_NODE_47_length_30979_cov_41.708841_26_plen_89_part_00